MLVVLPMDMLVDQVVVVLVVLVLVQVQEAPDLVILSLEL
jgi:phosphatidylglycerophosphate synthase